MVAISVARIGGALAGVWALAGCQSASYDALPVDPAARPPVPEAGPKESAAPAIDWAAAGDCRAKLRLLREAAAAGRLDDDAGPPIVVVAGSRVAKPWLRLPEDIKADLPLEVVRTDTAPVARKAPCLIRIEPAEDLDAEHRVVGEEAVESEYQSGVSRQKNPEYEVAKKRVDLAERRLKDDDELELISSGSPAADAVGLILGSLFAGFSQADEIGELDAALAELAETPEKIERPIYQSYFFDRVLVHARKRARIPIALEDRKRGRTFRTTLFQNEERQFAILQGLRKKDRHYRTHANASISKRDLGHWKRTPPELRLSTVVDALLAPDLEVEAGSEGGHSGFTAAGRQARATWRSDARRDTETDWQEVEDDTLGFADGALALGAGSETRAGGADAANAAVADPRFAAVVQVRKLGGGHGSGFYVARNLVITSFHVVKGESYVDLVTIAGDEAPAIVVASDPARDLALLHTPRPGPPVELHRGGPLVLGSEVEAIGSPRRFDFSISRGVVSAVRARQSVSTPGLQRVLYLQTDAALNPGNSGGPLFLGAAVVGVNTWAYGRDRGDEGLNFAVHVDEVIDFLEQNRDPVAVLD